MPSPRRSRRPRPRRHADEATPQLLPVLSFGTQKTNNKKIFPHGACGTSGSVPPTAPHPPSTPTPRGGHDARLAPPGGASTADTHSHPPRRKNLGVENEAVESQINYSCT